MLSCTRSRLGVLSKAGASCICSETSDRQHYSRSLWPDGSLQRTQTKADILCVRTRRQKKVEDLKLHVLLRDELRSAAVPNILYQFVSV